ncbi:heterokaryon incompatibility protein-domain-containing protein [Collybia nuda]|uniref:Heterokaryon incompatibility protein-domain-containing protein n=1 Tax=Collybia nuda TaxID=64659 RepID=A0A9P6C8F6_9AGAR|nr:heterokaryon incompatibility protein-domain-containing protein [Collybia nuda]
MSATEQNSSAKPNIVCNACRGLITALQDRFWRSLVIMKGNQAEIYPVLGRYLVHEVQASGLQGCHVCSLITQSVCPAHSQHDISHTPGSLITIKPGYIRPGPDANTLRLDSLQVYLSDTKGKRLRTETLQIVSDYEYHSHHPVPASWSISTSSEASFELASKWLRDCQSDHKLCEGVNATSVSGDENRLPTYFVYVGPEGPRLRRSIDLPTRPKYLTLSHRWGSSSIFQLTTKNLTSLLSEIPLSSLPKTFQDAILIAGRLGYQYIWIDSLCIVQDSREFWEQESAIMGEIYRGSVCTIAALGAVDGDSGCFKSRNPLCFQLFEFELGTGQVAYLIPPGNPQLMSPDHTGYGPDVEPLHERAWVIQEWMLSPRTIHYGTFGLYWECATESASDRVTRKVDSASRPSPKYAVHQSCTLPMTGELDTSYLEFWKMWSRVITMYSPCGLTYGTDKLVAINGIVKLVESKAGLHNIAGLWKEYIFPELLWTVQPTKRPAGAYQAPTWSWASFNCEVNLGILSSGYVYDWKIELLEAIVHPAANGQLLDARIRIRGPVQRVYLVKAGGNNYNLGWGKTVKRKNSADDRICFLPDVDPDPQQEVWALLVTHATDDTTWMNMGLVLSKKNTDEELWVRVGVFRQYDWKSETTGFFEDGGAEMRDLLIV